MTCRIKPLLSILLFVLAIIFSNAAQAQGCVQAVYLFRHAEDIGKNLTEVGKTHAALYPSMLPPQAPLFYPANCPVAMVFAMWDRNGEGTNNPKQTAKNLAADFDPSGKPEMFYTDLRDGKTYYLCEYPIDEPCAVSAGFKNNPNHRNALGTYDGATKPAIVDYLRSWFLGDGSGSSVAIFFSSDGLPALSTAFGVIPAVVDCPGYQNCVSKTPPFKNCPLPVSKETSICYKSDHPLLSWPGIARSSVDILWFTEALGFYNDTTYRPVSIPAKSALDNQLKMTYVQCFNFDNHVTPHKVVDGMYFCQNTGNIPDNAPGTIKGKICGLNSIYKYSPTNQNIFGYCTD